MEEAEKPPTIGLEAQSPTPRMPTSAESARSDTTVKGDIVRTPFSAPMTPSYPFPRMQTLSESPVASPGLQQKAFAPFTMLSPTIEPPSIKSLAKAKIAEDFKASGHVKLAMNKRPGTSGGVIPPSPPNALNVAIDLQTEPGLKGWWQGVCKVVRDSFGAQRAMLAVPSDITDVENVPWAQLGMFRGTDEDTLSRVTNDRTSDRSNLTDVSINALRQGHAEQPALQKATSKNKQAVQAKPSANPSLLIRPKLEFRHSFAGYPHKEEILGPDNFKAIEMPGKRPRLPRANSSAAAIQRQIKPAELSEETLVRHDRAYQSSSSQNPEGASRGYSRILDVVQPLESEADALIDGSGIFKVIHRGAPVVLTRQYKDTARDKKGGKHGKRDTPNKHPEYKSREQPLKRPLQRLSTSYRGKSYTASLRTLEESPEKALDDVHYEDFEQTPQSPWSQSPAPSPAARSENDHNPFFRPAGTIDEGAFDDECVADETPREQESAEYITAIGLDKASTIIQIPLIHPNAHVSQTMYTRREGRRDTNSTVSDRKSTKSASTTRLSDIQDESTATSDRYRKTPVAILSLLVPAVPYPVYLTSSLTDLAPLFATSFVTARQHTSMANQVASTSNLRQFTGGLTSDISFQTDSDASRSYVTIESDSAADRQRAHSPTSTNSLISEHSRQARSPTEPPFSSLKKPQTPGFLAAEAYEKTASETPKSPATIMEMNESYFLPAQPASGENASTTNKSAAKNSEVAVKAMKGDTSKKSHLHSQGASFAATHPALPTATASIQMTEAPAEFSKPGTPFAAIQAHTALRPSMSMLQTMIDNGAAQQWVAAGSDGKILWANAKFLVYRQSQGDDLDNDFWESVQPKERQAFRGEFSKALQTGDQLAYSCRLRRFNGQYRWFHIRIIPIKDRRGGTKFYHGQAMDIHEQHEAEQSALKAKLYRTSEAKYRALANSLPVIVFAAHIPTGMTFANTQWLSFSGQSQGQSLGFGFLDHVHPDDLRKCRFPGFDGTPFQPQSPQIGARHALVRQDSEASTSSAADSEGTSTTEHTVRPRRSADAETRSGPAIPSELLRSLSEDGIVVCGQDGQGNLSISTELRLKSKTGEYRWHVVTGSYMESVNFGSGEAQWFIACTDITSQKQTEARLQEAKLQVEQAHMRSESANAKLAREVKSKMSYLSSMSHEIRTPLNGIIGNLQFLINTGLNDEQNEWAHGAKDAATNMSELINDILDLSKAEANMLHLSSHSFSPREITENVLDQLNSKVTEKKLELSLEIDGLVPHYLRGDSGRMRQVLLNLVSNAVKFTSRGEIWVSCDMLNYPCYDLPKLGENERYVHWTINDTGKGFSEEDKNLLFKEYSQIKKRKDRDIGGTGLGLILCKTMVELHGGRIEARGAQGKGACFSFFARFKLRKERTKAKGPLTKQMDILARKGSTGGAMSAISPPVPSPGSAGSVSPSRFTGPPPSRYTASPSATGPAVLAPSEIAETQSAIKVVPQSAIRLPNSSSTTSPSVSSAGSSILSSISTQFSRSMRSSMSTASSEERVAAITLTLPELISKPVESAPLLSHISLSKATTRADSKEISSSFETTGFRPPMYSVLLYCPAPNARRITAKQIQYVVPKAVPCQLTTEADASKALLLLSGDDPVNFTHIVIRTTIDSEVLEFIDHLIGSPTHAHASLVLITDQAQLKAIAALRPGLDIKSLQAQDKLVVLQRPCHTYKLAKIFDPLKENEVNAEDLQAAKRTEEKRLQKESYALFKAELGRRNLRILAVEDNLVQMNVLCNFLGKICGLAVESAWNGKECLDMVRSKPPLYYSVIVSDIEMPLIGGYEMVMKLRQWEKEMGYPPVPTVSLSANTVKEGWVASAEAGFTQYCPKPVNFRDLGHVLLEVTQPGTPHILLKDRPPPKELSGTQESSSDEESDDE